MSNLLYEPSVQIDFSKFQHKNYSGHKKKVYDVNWNCTGSNLASASADSSIQIWNLQSNGLEKGFELKGHSDIVQQIQWHPHDKNILGSASNDKTLKIWDIQKNKAIQNIKTKGSNYSMAWHPDGNLVAVGQAVGNKDDQITFFDLRQSSNQTKNHLLKFEFEVNEISWDYSGNLFFITTGVNTTNGPIYVVDGKSPALPPLEILNCHQGTSFCIAMSPDKKHFATGAIDCIVALWDMHEMVLLQTYTKLEQPIRQLSFSFDGKIIAAASQDEHIDIFDLQSGLKLHSIDCKAPQNSVSWHPKEYILAFGGEDKKSNNDEGLVHLFGMNIQ